ncbi:MAG: site-specific integrase [Clostridiaceae bacterium]
MSKKRANGEGTIFQRSSDKTWVGRVPIGYKPDGSIKMHIVYGRTQKEVKDKLDEAKGNIRNNTFVEPHKVTIQQWLDTWLNITIKGSIKDTTWLIYESLIKNHINPEIGGIRLLNLQASHIQKLYNDKLYGGRSDKRKNKETGELEQKEGGLSPKTIRHIHQVIKGSLDQAVKERYLQVNPAAAVKLPKLIKKEMKTLNIEQVKKFLETASTNKYYKRYYAAYLLELYTGLRRGELLGLRWKDIDFKNYTVKVVQQLVKVGSSHILRELKTESSQNRVIAITDDVIQALKEHKKNKAEEYEFIGYKDTEIKKMMSEGLIFTNELGNLLQPRNFLRNFKGTLKASGIDPIRFHDMRHTFALLSLQQGVDIKTLQSDLGHESIETTLDRYGHVNEGMKRDAAKKRSEILKDIY